MLWTFTVSLLTTFISVNGAGEFTVLQSPDWLSFSGKEEIEQSNIKNVLALTLGFTVPESTRWSGLVVKDSFHFADAVVLFSASGVSSLEAGQSRSYPVASDDSLRSTFNSLEWGLRERYPSVENITALPLRLSDRQQIEEKVGELNLRELPTSEYLSPDSAPDRAFLDQLQILDALTTKLCSRMCNDQKDAVVTDGVPDVYWVHCDALESIVKTYGPDSSHLLEAKRMLSSGVLLLSEVFNTGYDYQVVFATVTTDESELIRYRRDIDDPTGEKNGTSSPGKVAAVDDNFAAMFNIILWFNIALAFATIAVCYGIATMDPGRDSIIYRMTSNRMKKDN